MKSLTTTYDEFMISCVISDKIVCDLRNMADVMTMKSFHDYNGCVKNVDFDT
jgi:hypothetical protein